MPYSFVPLRWRDATAAARWRYEGPYAIYNFDGLGLLTTCQNGPQVAVGVSIGVDMGVPVSVGAAAVLMGVLVGVSAGLNGSAGQPANTMPVPTNHMLSNESKNMSIGTT